ncbi:hypothetical protein [Geothrix edaphica]|uniref:Lipoprotein n=1 Tax=Geothrix edaphica TaxID=2927976 RepID=A0ABQ5Q152_9BACT|nr:hypothetical protein [Geothrix edaphica]GLH68313.1 hypothetical protein GETHED_26770 [Geothrix edaphica]
MPLYRASLRALGAVALLAAALACGGKKGGTTSAPSTTISLSGSVTYVRVPLATDANGVPTGLADSTVATNLKTLPARGVLVRTYQRLDQLNPDGSTKTPVWLVASEVYTDSTGHYSTIVDKDKPLMVELLSSFNGGTGSPLNLIGDPAGINSTVIQANRYRYAMRKAIDGTAPSGNPAPATIPAGDSVVDFAVGLTDPWWLVNANYLPGNRLAPEADDAILETTLPGRTIGTGSRILAIGDTAASFLAVYGTATPGAALDLHYAPGVSEARGSFVEYDRTTYPLAYDASFGSLHYFGSLQGGPTNDDAWDEGVILPLLSRGVLFSRNLGRTFGFPLAPLFPVAMPLPDLSPDSARVEGFADAMAANILKSPYLADTQGTTLATPVLDIRDVSSLATTELTPYSAPAIRALSWEVILKANSVAAPGGPATWSTLNPLAAGRFFSSPSLTNGATDSTARDIEPLNIYSQLARLKEARSSSEPVDLAPIFTDAVLTPLTAPYGIVWPRPTTGTYASFAANWGTDPNALTTPLAPFTLSMGKAVQVRGFYPNQSEGEVFYSGFSLSADKRYVIGVTISPALAAGGELDLDLPLLGRTFTFSGSGGTTPATILTVSTTAPVYHPVRVRLKSPAVLQPDVAVTVSFTPSL